MNAVEFEGADYGTEETPETLLAAMEEDRRVCGGAITVENGYRIHEATGKDYRITRILVDASCHRKLHYSKKVVEPALVIQGL